MFSSAGCSLLRAEGFSCSLDVLYGGLGSREGFCKLQFLIKKRFKQFFCCIFFLQFFCHQNPESGLDLDPDSLEILDPDPQL
jgi:hypothetical protein